MTKDELLDKAIYWFKVIAEDMERITSGNLPHNSATTKGRAIRAYEFLEKHKNDESKQEWSEEDEKAIGIIKSALKHPYDMDGKWDRQFALDWLESLKPNRIKL